MTSGPEVRIVTGRRLERLPGGNFRSDRSLSGSESILQKREMLSVAFFIVMLSIVVLIVVMLSVILLSVVMLSVLAQVMGQWYKTFFVRNLRIFVMLKFNKPFSIVKFVNYSKKELQH